MWGDLILPILIIGIFYLIWFLRDNCIKGFHGPKGLPLLGNALDLLRLGNATENTIPYISSLVERFGVRTQFSLGWMTFAVLVSPKDVEKVLGSSVHIDKGILYDFIKDWLGNGIVTVSGEKWQRQRKLLTPSFHYEILRQFLPTMNEHSRVLVDCLKQQGDKYFDASPLLTNAALDIICETAIGRKVNAQTDPHCHYGNAVHAVSTMIQQRIFRPWLHPDFLWRLSSLGKNCLANLKIIHDFTRDVIKEKKAERNEKSQQKNNEGDFGTKKEAFLDLLLKVQEDTDKLLTDQDILYEVCTFMFAGHDSTGRFFNWALLELGNHPEIQATIQQELDEIFEGDSTRPVTMDDLRQMNYLEMVIKETLRVHPVLPSIMRQIISPCTLDSECTLPPEVTVWIFIHGLHHDPVTFPSPFTFDPQRFSIDKSSERHPYAFVPFSAGPRNCIGQKFAMMEVKTVLAYILRHFSIHSEHTMDYNPPVWELTLKPKHGVRIKLIPRHQS